MRICIVYTCVGIVYIHKYIFIYIYLYMYYLSNANNHFKFNRALDLRIKHIKKQFSYILVC